MKKTQKVLSVSIGDFDGIHLGHIEVIKSATYRQNNNTTPAVITFDKEKNDLLLTREEKQRRLYDLGVEEIIYLTFSEICDLSPEQFVNSILKERLDVKYVSVGFNFKFGKKATGNSNELTRLCKKAGIEVFTCDAVKVQGVAESTSMIKEYLKKGDVKRANQMLGYEFFNQSEVVRGEGRGEKLGFRTINQFPDEDAFIPRLGVYLSRVLVNNEWKNGITNIGTRPTIGVHPPRYETHLFDCDADLYGQNLKLELISFVRGERKFETLKALKTQMEMDIASAKKRLED